MKHSKPTCFSCGNTKLKSILNYGQTPLADRLLTKEQLKESELTAPLELVFCPNCKLVQITESVSPEILFFKDYPYFSSVSPALLEHFRKSAVAIIRSQNSILITLLLKQQVMMAICSRILSKRVFQYLVSIQPRGQPKQPRKQGYRPYAHSLTRILLIN